MKWIVLIVYLIGSSIPNTLMGTMVIVFHLPQLELVPPIVSVNETHLVKQFLFVSTVAALNEPIAPGLARGNQGVQAAMGLQRFGEARRTLRVGRVAHGEVHGIIGKGDKKGGSTSIERLNTSASVSLC